MKNQQEVIRTKFKKTYVKPEVVKIAIDHEVSLVMMSESPTPPTENLGVIFKPLIFLR